MANGSVKSALSFRSYKIEKFNYEMQKNIGLVEFQRGISPELWEFQLAIRQPVFYKERKVYLCGIESKIYLLPKEKEPLENALLKIEASIVGTFEVLDPGTDEEIINKLIKIQMPAILMPYLRGTITTFLSSGGFSSVLLPLINVQELAKETLKDTQILIRD